MVEAALPTTSVVMATFNGERHLDEQLASLASQRLHPRELVVVDDCSSDATRERLEHFARGAPFPVRISMTDQREGPARAFERAIAQCGGDLIALCDQDDRWHPDKLLSVAQALADRPAAGWAFTDGCLIDEAGRATGRTLWEHFGVPATYATGASPRFPALTVRNRVLGCTLVFRAELRRVVLPLPPGLYAAHDAWAVSLLEACAPPVALDRRLVGYRIHPAQLSGLPGRGGGDPHDRLAARLAWLQPIRERLRDPAVGPVPPTSLHEIDALVAHVTTRLDLPPRRSSRAAAVVRELWADRYHRYSSGFRSALLDLTRSN